MSSVPFLHSPLRTRLCMDTGATPLVIASGQGHVSVVQALLQGGADVDKTADGGFTPICPLLSRTSGVILTPGRRPCRCTPSPNRSKIRLPPSKEDHSQCLRQSLLSRPRRVIQSAIPISIVNRPRVPGRYLELPNSDLNIS
jgi:hypothetical protein